MFTSRAEAPALFQRHRRIKSNNIPDVTQTSKVSDTGNHSSELSTTSTTTTVTTPRAKSTNFTEQLALGVVGGNFEGLDRFHKDFRIVSHLPSSSSTSSASSYSPLHASPSPPKINVGDQNVMMENDLSKSIRSSSSSSGGVSAPVITGEQSMLVEDHKTSKRFIATRLSFESLDDANKSYCDHWRFMRFVQKTHENLVCLTKIYVEKSDVYIVKQRFTDNLIEYLMENDFHTRQNRSQSDSSGGGSDENVSSKSSSSFSIEVLLDFMIQLSMVLSHLHQMGYIHGLCELIPQRIFMTDMFSKLLLDVGKSTSVFNEQTVRDNAQHYMKSAFVAPEIKLNLRRGEWKLCENTERGDMFVLGVIFYMIITLSSCGALEQIFHMDQLESYTKTVEQNLKRVNCDEKLMATVLRCLDPNPMKRPKATHVHFILSQLQLELETKKKNKKFIRDVESESTTDMDGGTNSNRTRSSSVKNNKLGIKLNKKNTIFTVVDKSAQFSDTYSRLAEGVVLSQSRSACHGWLHKQKKLNMWDERYMFLSDYNYLYCCKSSEEPLVVRSKIKIEPDQFIINANVTVKNSRGFPFKLVTEDITVVLSAATEADRTKWINAIRNISSNPRPLPQTIDLSQELDSKLYSNDDDDEEDGDGGDDQSTDASSGLTTDQGNEANEEHRYLRRIKKLRSLNVRMIDYKSVTIVRKIAQGGFGQVYLVTVFDTVTQSRQQLAMKVMLESDITNDDFKEFLNEVRIMSLLDHPNVLPLYGVCCDSDRLCLFTKYMSRGGLDAVMNNTSTTNKPYFTLNQRLRMMLDAARGMAYLHSRVPAVIHRDLKSANLLVDDSFNITVCDFGMARLKTRSMGKTAYVSTWNYMPPEKMQAPDERPMSDSEMDRLEEAGDIYSFAVICYEIVTRLPVFPDALYPMQIATIVSRGDRPQFPSPEEAIQQSIADDVNLYSKLKQLIVSSWDQNPTNRPSFAELVERIEKLIN